MFAIKSVTLLFFTFIIVSDCERRIVGGSELQVDRRYVVYLVKAPLSKSGYVNWLCGGAIVSSEFVVTSAACVKDVDYIYVIAGYRKYIDDANIESDRCTKKMKKRVAYACWPRSYQLRYDDLNYWSFVDIAMVKVDSPFNFEDPEYSRLCSYQPSMIAINNEEKYQAAGTDAIVLGWGHTQKWRLSNDTNNYNELYLRYAPTLILNKTSCVDHYKKDYDRMSEVINRYMICSLGKGDINDSGKPIHENPFFQNGCTSNQEKILGFEGVSCESTEYDNYEGDDSRSRRHGKAKGTTKNKTKTKTRSNPRNKNKKRNFSSSDFDKTNARRNGICQNDHGGPIVTWAGANEILIGVASVFKVSENYDCMGPYLYTSTMCAGSFLYCILHSEFYIANDTRRSDSRRYLCDLPTSEKGYEKVERTISWDEYPGRDAEKENIEWSISEPQMAPHTYKYLTNNNYRPPSPDYARKQMDTYGNPENKSISGEESLPVNDRYSDIDRSHDNETSPASTGHSTIVTPAVTSEAPKTHQGQEANPQQPL